MFSSTNKLHVFDELSLRWFARASAAVLVVAWAVLVSVEAIRNPELPALQTFYQACALAIVFAGYAIGLRNELAGGLVVILGTLVFFAVLFVTMQALPQPAAVLFALPGVLYLLTWLMHRRAPQA
jgi:hypothetical protein